MQNGLKINDATSNEGSFDVGCAIIKELVLELDNSNKQLSDIDFSNAKFDVRIGLVIEQKYPLSMKHRSMHSEIRCSGTTISFGIIPTGRS